MSNPLMPKATAVWLVDNTALSFVQIAWFCGLHELEVQAIADGDVAAGMQGLDPVAAHVLTREELARCEADPSARLEATKSDLPETNARQKGARYTPVSKRQERPDAIAWLVKNYPELTDGQIGKMLGTTKPTIVAIRERSHWNITNIKPQNPVGLGLCSEIDLQKAVERARKRITNAEKRAQRDARKAAEAAGTPPTAPQESPFPAGTDPNVTSNEAPSFPADPDQGSAPTGESVVEPTHGDDDAALANAAITGHDAPITMPDAAPEPEDDPNKRHTLESVFGASGSEPEDDSTS